MKALCLDDKILPGERQAFIENYQPDQAIQWYTRNGFLYRSINQALARRNAEVISRYQVFITDLLRALNLLYEDFLNKFDPTIERRMLTLYRGQVISADELSNLRRSIGEYVTLNSFLSTSASISVASMFTDTGSVPSNASAVSILFTFDIDLRKNYTSSFASVVSQSFHADEEEYLFAMGAVFRIEKIEKLSTHLDLTVIHLRMADQLEIDQFFSDIVDESKWRNRCLIDIQLISFLELHYHIANHPHQFDRVEHFDEVEKVLQGCFSSFVDVNQIVELENVESDDEVLSSLVLPNRFGLLNRPKQLSEIRYEPFDTHLNDLIYILISDMQKKKRWANAKKLHQDLMSLHKPPRKFHLTNFFWCPHFLTFSGKRVVHATATHRKLQIV